MACGACKGEVHPWGYSDGFDYCRVCGEGLPATVVEIPKRETPLQRTLRWLRGDLTGDEVARALDRLRNPDPSLHVTVRTLPSGLFEVHVNRSDDEATGGEGFRR
jgi:hypothetical protein